MLLFKLAALASLPELSYSFLFSPSSRGVFVRRVSPAAGTTAATTTPGNARHLDEQAYAVETDQLVFQSEGFWALVDSAIDLDDPGLDRFYDFCMNLQVGWNRFFLSIFEVRH